MCLCPAERGRPRVPAHRTCDGCAGRVCAERDAHGVLRNRCCRRGGDRLGLGRSARRRGGRGCGRGGAPWRSARLWVGARCVLGRSRGTWRVCWAGNPPRRASRTCLGPGDGDDDGSVSWRLGEKKMDSRSRRIAFVHGFETFSSPRIACSPSTLASVDLPAAHQSQDSCQLSWGP